MTDLRAELQRSARSIVEQDPRVANGDFLGIVLGSGLGGVVDVLDDLVEIPYDRIDGFAATTVAGHSGTLCIGTLDGTLLVVLRGRVHLYEGHDADAVVHGVRTLVHLGASAVLLTNAAGGVREDLGVGHLMVIDDHINLTGQNPLIGNGATQLGPLFPDMTQAWDPDISEALFAAGTGAGVPTARGVYAGVLGPSYETPAEVRMIGRLGGDAVGMSTVFEAIAVRHMGGRLGGVSVISNAAAGTGEPGSTLDHEHVSDVAIAATKRFTALLRRLIADRTTWGGASA